MAEPSRFSRGKLPSSPMASVQRAIALSPEMAAAYVDLGVAFLREGNLAQGLGQLEAGLNVPSPVPPAPSWDAAIAALRPCTSVSDCSRKSARRMTYGPFSPEPAAEAETPKSAR